MTWYSGLIVLKSEVDDVRNERNLWERVVVVVQANTFGDAVLRLSSIGKRKESSYLNVEGSTVTWSFVELLEVQEVESFSDGAEVHSLLFWEGEPS